VRNMSRNAIKNIGLSLLLLPITVLAADADYTIVIKDHQFQPAELIVPEGKKVKLIVENQDATPEEFESHELNREKIIAAKSKATIYIGPLKPGRYPFFGEFNQATAQGAIVVK
jgi:Cupredoxin-like domain